MAFFRKKEKTKKGVQAKDKDRFLDLDPNFAQEAKPKQGITQLVVTVLGVVMLCTGVALGLFLPKYPEMGSLVDACMRPAGAQVPGEPAAGAPIRAQAQGEPAAGASPGALDPECKIAVYEFERANHETSKFSTLEFLANALSALGLALVISILVTRTVERSNRKRFASSLDRKTRELSEAVMRGMFNRRHPEQLINLVSSKILQRDLVRERMNVHYILKQWKPPAGTDVSRLNGRRFVEVKATISTITTNVSGSDTLIGQTSPVPVGLILPNPTYDELKSSIRVKDVQINGTSLERKVIDAANAKLMEDLCADKLVAQASFEPVDLRPSQSVRLRLVYTMVKELEDSELFQTLQISKDLSITLTDTTGWDLRVRAKAVGFGFLEEVSSDDTTHHWTIHDILLPHQGVLIWWKERLVGPLLPSAPCNATGADEVTGQEGEPADESHDDPADAPLDELPGNIDEFKG